MLPWMFWPIQWGILIEDIFNVCWYLNICFNNLCIWPRHIHPEPEGWWSSNWWWFVLLMVLNARISFLGLLNIPLWLPGLSLDLSTRMILHTLEYLFLIKSTWSIILKLMKMLNTSISFLGLLNTPFLHSPWSIPIQKTVDFYLYPDPNVCGEDNCLDSRDDRLEWKEEINKEEIFVTPASKAGQIFLPSQADWKPWIVG